MIDQPQPVNISLWNATGLPKHNIDNILTHLPNTSILFITETWLLPPNKFLTSWKQYHTYGTPRSGMPFLGQMGITLLVNPDCPYEVNLINNPNSSHSNFTLSCTIANTLVHCLYLPPPPSFNENTALEILDSLPTDIPGITNTLYCGDFNARLGDRVGDHAITPRGYKLISWLDTTGQTLWNAELAHGLPTNYRHHGTSIVDLFFGDTDLLNPQMLIRDDLSLDSEHKIVYLTFTPAHAPLTYSQEPMRKTWFMQQLKHPVKYDAYVNAFAEAIAPVTARLEHYMESPVDGITVPIDDLTTDLNNAIYDSLDKTLGRKGNKAYSRLKWFWTPELDQAVKRREHFYTKWRRALTAPNKLKWWLKHQEAKAQFRLALTRRRAETWRTFCTKLDNGNFTAASATMKQIRRSRTIHPTFTHPEGPTAAANQMADHLEGIFSGSYLSRPAVITSITDANMALMVSPRDDANDLPFSTEEVKKALKSLPNTKAPGADHLRGDMIKPILEQLTPPLTALFNLCWYTSTTPEIWRRAQIVPIYKKGPLDDPANYRPISLTSIFRKTLEKCLQAYLLSSAPPLDPVQGGFRSLRSALDQARSLHELSDMHKKLHGATPVLAFCDIKSAYDTVDRRIVWQALENHVPELLLLILKNLFDDVFVEVLLSNTVSRRFRPITGVLQGSVLSPSLYSYYINSLPSLLRDVESELTHPDTSDFQPPPSININGHRINCLLYADDVALIGTWQTLPALLRACEQHGNKLGYRWNPSKCVVLAETDPPPGVSAKLYDTELPRANTFPYLGIPFTAGGSIDPAELVSHNAKSAVQGMGILYSIGVRPRCLGRLLCSRLYRQFIRPKMEYGLAIIVFNKKNTEVLEKAQSNCLRQIYGAHKTSSTAVMLHMARLVPMKDRIATLQAQFLVRAHNLPPDALLALLLPQMMRTNSRSWARLKANNPIWATIPRPQQDITTSALKAALRSHLQKMHEARCAKPNSTLLQACRPHQGIDPILFIPMSATERLLCIRYRLGWLPNGKPAPCPRCRHSPGMNKRHILECFAVHRQLNLPTTVLDPISHIFNRLPLSPPKTLAARRYWKTVWPKLCAILKTLSQQCNPGYAYQVTPADQLGQALLQWMEPPAPLSVQPPSSFVT